VYTLHLKKLRVDHNMTRQEVAKKLGISAQAYGNYENGRRDPSIDALKKIAELYNVSIDFIVGNSQDKVQEGNNVLLLNTDGLTQANIQEIKQYINFLRYKSKAAN
jgi:transcriptional regulator with XRE-family HTH domain